MKIGRVALPVILGLAFYFAVFGGEYSWLEVRETRERILRDSVELAELRRQIDSLRARADSLENDPATLERLARERFGMIRDGEVLYRFVEPEDSAEMADSAETAASAEDSAGGG